MKRDELAISETWMNRKCLALIYCEEPVFGQIAKGYFTFSAADDKPSSIFITVDEHCKKNTDGLRSTAWLVKH